jgi:shikimate kinase
MSRSSDDKPAGDNLILIGMPAVGKSTAGVLLAKCMGYAFVDTDLLIQTGEQARLEQIIAKIGLEPFCDLEARYILSLAVRRTVIATGGSVIYRRQAMVHLQALGKVLFLDIALAPLIERLNSPDARGVVHLPGQTIDMLYCQRRPLYLQYAHKTIDCTHCTPEQVVGKIVTAGDSFTKGRKDRGRHRRIEQG